jgi:hypothetical protein
MRRRRLENKLELFLPSNRLLLKCPQKYPEFDVKSQ